MHVPSQCCYGRAIVAHRNQARACLKVLRSLIKYGMACHGWVVSRESVMYDRSPGTDHNDSWVMKVINPTYRIGNILLGGGWGLGGSRDRRGISEGARTFVAARATAEDGHDGPWPIASPPTPEDPGPAPALPVHVLSLAIPTALKHIPRQGGGLWGAWWHLGVRIQCDCRCAVGIPCCCP